MEVMEHKIFSLHTRREGNSATNNQSNGENHTISNVNKHNSTKPLIVMSPFYLQKTRPSFLRCETRYIVSSCTTIEHTKRKRKQFGTLSPWSPHIMWEFPSWTSYLFVETLFRSFQLTRGDSQQMVSGKRIVDRRSRNWENPWKLELEIKREEY